MLQGARGGAPGLPPALRALPAWLGELQNLQKVHLCSCSGLTALPESMCRLTGLRSLEQSSVLDYAFCRWNTCAQHENL